MSYETLKIEKRSNGAAWLWLNRPDAHNAMSEQMLIEVPDAVAELEADADVRAVVLSGAGPTFCAGGDLKWMLGIMKLSRAERIEESRKVATILGALNNLGKPLIGRINGNAYGGGVGMVSVCDIAIAVRGARFALTETKLGLVPANIGPYVVNCLGANNARQVFFNAKPFDAERARQLGLVSEVVEVGDLDAAVDREVGYILACAPGAVAMTKKLLFHIDAHGLEGSIDYAMEQLALAWEGEEAAEGIQSFLDKRKPRWSGPGGG
ncbi:MAG: crotonase/enoyl-CoA hydratase family protein [Alphaproteobacteria bacterium]